MVQYVKYFFDAMLSRSGVVGCYCIISLADLAV